MLTLKKAGMVEIFKTNVEDKIKSEIIVKKLNEHFPSYFINFDLDDCDKILRVEYSNGNIDIESIINVVEKHSADIALITE